VCGKHIQLSKLKEWIQRHVEYSEIKTLMAFLQDLMPGEQKHPKWLQQAFYSPGCKVLIDWVLWSVHSSWRLPKFPIGLFFKYASLRIGQILEAGFSGICLPLCQEGLPVIHAFWHTHSFYPFPRSIVIYPSQFKFSYQLALPQHPQTDASQD
jgi:hypothetical protein